ncbi:hypothetical protein D3C87_2068510 [compost metagenome]
MVCIVAGVPLKLTATFDASVPKLTPLIVTISTSGKATGFNTLAETTDVIAGAGKTVNDPIVPLS